jgi:MFS family permease
MRRTREVAVLMRLVAVYSVFGVPYLVLLPVIARDVLHRDARAYALLLTCVGVGALVAALALAAGGQRVRRGRLLALAAHLFALLLVAFSLSRSLALSAALLLGVGFTMILNNALANALLQSVVPDALRGRVMAAYAFVFVGMGPFGSLFAGAAAKAIGAAGAVGLGAAMTFGYALWAFARSPEIRRM